MFKKTRRKKLTLSIRPTYLRIKVAVEADSIKVGFWPLLWMSPCWPSSNERIRVRSLVFGFNCFRSTFHAINRIMTLVYVNLLLAEESELTLFLATSVAPS